MGAAYGKCSPPAELKLAWQCKNWGTLPRGGGLFDQPAKLMERMTSLDNIHKTVSKMSNMVGKEIHNLTVSERKIIKALQDGGFI